MLSSTEGEGGKYEGEEGSARKEVSPVKRKPPFFKRAQTRSDPEIATTVRANQCRKSSSNSGSSSSSSVFPALSEEVTCKVKAGDGVAYSMPQQPRKGATDCVDTLNTCGKERVGFSKMQEQ